MNHMEVDRIIQVASIASESGNCDSRNSTLFLQSFYRSPHTIVRHYRVLEMHSCRSLSAKEPLILGLSCAK